MAGWLCFVGSETTRADQANLATPDDECAPLAVQPVLGNTMVLGFMVHVGFCIAASTHIGSPPTSPCRAPGPCPGPKTTHAFTVGTPGGRCICHLAVPGAGIQS
jgi:hypothetical protein